MSSHTDRESVVAGIQRRLDTLQLQEAALEGEELQHNTASQAELTDLLTLAKGAQVPAELAPPDQEDEG